MSRKTMYYYVLDMMRPRAKHGLAGARAPQPEPHAALLLLLLQHGAHSYVRCSLRPS